MKCKSTQATKRKEALDQLAISPSNHDPSHRVPFYLWDQRSNSVIVSTFFLVLSLFFLSYFVGSTHV